ncbi:MAG: transketolase [Acidobacteria bacterium]|nr:transketolase [Acidobacteriota bacterium]
MPVTPEMLAGLKDKATQLRIDSVRSTSAAGSGHPTTCASAAELMSALFFKTMRYDPQNPADPANDIFILSKGHAAPILYAAWAEAGYLKREDLLNLRKIDSDLEGHPPVTLPFVDVATGSLGQGLPVGVGMAAVAKLDKRDQRIFVLMGDGETAEGSVWEAASMASYDKLDNLIAIVDVNRLGQSRATMLEHDMAAHKARWEAFGWHAIVVDGHDMEAVVAAFDEAITPSGKPAVILAKTFKGRGIPFAEDHEDWHGKAFTGDKETEALAALESQFVGSDWQWQPNLPAKSTYAPAPPQPMPAPPYALGGKEVATREAFGAALAAIGKADERVVVFDADVGNSTYTLKLKDVAPERFFQSFIAEQVMVGAAMGAGCRGKIPFASSFACFLTRAADFVRMGAISKANLKLVGTHAGISIGEDGPSQMGLEDLSMTACEPGYTVLYPSDATSAWRAIELVAGTHGPAYVRTSRPKTPIVYGPDEPFEIGKAKVVRQSDADQAVVVGAGVTLFEALKAADALAAEGVAVRVVDLFSIQPVDQELLIASAKAAGGKVVTVEDHFPHGGVGDAVLGALAGETGVQVVKLAVRQIARSGQPDELLDKYGISAPHIVTAVKSLLG